MPRYFAPERIGWGEDAAAVDKAVYAALAAPRFGSVTQSVATWTVRRRYGGLQADRDLSTDG